MRTGFRLLVSVLCATIALAPVAQAADCEFNSKRTKVVGGFAAKKGDHPYQAFILVDKDSRCGGTLIAPNAVLTAGHCVTFDDGTPIPKEEFVIRIGSIEAFQGGDVFDPQNGTGVKAIHVAPGFNRTTLINDAAILILSKPSKFKPLKLEGISAPQSFRDEDLTGKFGTVLGWGLVDPDDWTNIPSVLRYAPVPIVPHKACIQPASVGQQLESFGAIDERRICAGGAKGVDTCDGDSGGPLLYTSPSGGVIQIGLTSYGLRKCGTAGAFGVYSRVKAFKTFLTAHVDFSWANAPAVADNSLHPAIAVADHVPQPSAQTRSPGVVLASARSGGRFSEVQSSLKPIAVWLDGTSRFSVTSIPGVVNAASDSAADFVWNPQTGDVFRRGAERILVAQGALDIGRLSGVISKWRMLPKLEALQNSEPLDFRLKEAQTANANTPTFRAGDDMTPVIRFPKDGSLKYLTLFLLAGDGSVQFFYPRDAQASGELTDAETSLPTITAQCPFGVDHWVAITTEARPSALRERLKELGDLNYPAAFSAVSALEDGLKGRYAIKILSARTKP